MEDTRTISTNTIISLLVFICAAIMSSVFIFHASHKETRVIASENSTIFTAPRDIKPFDLVSMDGNKFTQANFKNHWTLLVFGFTHCSSVCPITLEMMSHAYNKLHSQYSNLQVVFVSLDPERDSIEKLAKYTQGFNANFIGVSGKIQELHKLQSQLGIFAARDDATAANYQIQHTSSILLINPKGQWAGMFQYGMQPEVFAETFSTSIKKFA